MKLNTTMVAFVAAFTLGVSGAAFADSSSSNATAVTGSNASNGGNSVTVCVNPGSCPDSPPAPDTRALPAPAETTQVIKNVPTTIAPALTSTLTETCMGSSSVGASGIGFGVSFGTTWRDVACVRRLDSREIAKYSQQVAFEMMCDSDAVRNAAERAAKKYGKDHVPTCAAADAPKAEPKNEETK